MKIKLYQFSFEYPIPVRVCKCLPRHVDLGWVNIAKGEKQSMDFYFINTQLAEVDWIERFIIESE